MPASFCQLFCLQVHQHSHYLSNNWPHLGWLGCKLKYPHFFFVIICQNLSYHCMYRVLLLWSTVLMNLLRATYKLRISTLLFKSACFDTSGSKPLHQMTFSQNIFSVRVICWQLQVVIVFIIIKKYVIIINLIETDKRVLFSRLELLSYNTYLSSLDGLLLPFSILFSLSFWSINWEEAVATSGRWYLLLNSSDIK